MLIQERLESVKTGVLGAFIFSIGYFLVKIIHFIFNDYDKYEINIFSVIITVSSGFLFAVTYRYLIKNDENPHLRDGAVLAFAIVRTFGREFNLDEILTIGLLGVENIFYFLITRYSIDCALNNKWFKHFFN